MLFLIILDLFFSFKTQHASIQLSIKIKQNFSYEIQQTKINSITSQILILLSFHEIVVSMDFGNQDGIGLEYLRFPEKSQAYSILIKNKKSSPDSKQPLIFFFIGKTGLDWRKIETNSDFVNV